MNEETKAKLHRYGELKIQEKDVKSELESLKPFVREVLMSADGAKIEMKEGVLSLKEVPVWQFSDDTMMMKAALKEKESIEKKMGVATSTPRHDVIFKESK